MKGKLFLVVVLVTFVLSGWSPVLLAQHAQAADGSTATQPLVINNKTKETVQLTLTGPATYVFTVQPGKSTQQLLPGKYQYTYNACEGKKKGTVVVSNKSKQLVLAACPKNKKTKGKEVRVNINNRTGGTVMLNLTGPANYQFSLKSGTSAIWVLKGTYTYTGWGCGASLSGGPRKLKSGMIWTWFCISY